VGLKQLIAVEKWTCLLAAAVLAVGLIVLPRHAAFSLAVGAGLSTLNAVAIRRIAQRLGVVLQQKPSLTILLFNLKMVLLIGLIFVAIRWLGVDAVPFIVGISMLPVAIFVVFVQHALSPRSPSDNEETHG